MSTKKKSNRKSAGTGGSATALAERPTQSKGFVPRGEEDFLREQKQKREKAKRGRPEKLPLSVRMQDRFGPRGVKTIHLLLTALSRLAVAAIAYVLVSVSVTTAVPLLGILMVDVSGVSDDSGTLAILATWMAPLIFLVIVLAIVESLIVRALWKFAAKSTKQMGRNLGAIDDNATIKEK